jgi:hypothetical protein
MTTEHGTHSSSRNVIGKLTLHTVQNPENQKSVFITRWKFKIKNLLILIVNMPQDVWSVENIFMDERTHCCIT